MPDLTDRDVLCVRDADICSLFATHPPAGGFLCGAERWLTPLLSDRAPLWLPRTPALETDTTLVQVVAYVVARSHGLYALFRRTQAGGDPRLHGRLTLGLGGHVERQDAKAGSVHSALVRAAFRELDEEVDFSQPPHEFRRAGLLYDPADAVGARHLGVVYLAEYEHSACRVLCPSLELVGWIDRSWLAYMAFDHPDVESWTRILLQWLILRSHPGPA